MFTLLIKLDHKISRDRAQVTHLLTWCYEMSYATNNYVINQIKPLLRTHKPVILHDGTYNSLLNQMNSIIKNAITIVCLKFQSINKPLISAIEVSKLINFFKKTTLLLQCYEDYACLLQKIKYRYKCAFELR